MSGKESVRNGILVLVLLIGFGAISAVWPILAGTSSQSHTRVPVETEHVEITLPFGDPPQELSLTGLQALGILAGVATVLIIGGGVTFALVSRLISGQTDAVLESDAYKSNVASLEQRGKERLKATQEGRKSQSAPEHKMPRWSMTSTTLIVLMLVAFFGLVINGTFYPEGSIELPDSGMLASSWITELTDGIIASSWLTVGIPVLLALLVALWRLRPQKLEASAADNAAIPWDFIAVLLTGLLVIGLGIGFIVYYNVPI